MKKPDRKKLLLEAIEARKSAYAPYSHFRVGAALLTKDGSVYTGCNIENSSYSATNCAERTAVFKAVSDGVRDFEAIAVAGAREGEEPSEICAPCGICRQVLTEFCEPSFEIILGTADGEPEIYTLGELQALAFKL